MTTRRAVHGRDAVKSLSHYRDVGFSRTLVDIGWAVRGGTPGTATSAEAWGRPHDE